MSHIAIIESCGTGGKAWEKSLTFIEKAVLQNLENHIKGNFLLILQFVALFYVMKKLTLDHQKSHISYNLIFNS